MKTTKNAWLFDVDGVITNPEQKRVTEPQILDEIAKRLQRNEPVALITGRNLEWVTDRVASQLETKVTEKKLLDNLFVSGEFGGSFTIYRNGQRNQKVDEEIRVPQDIIEKAREIAAKFSDSMFFDESKKTMVSIEMNDNLSIDQFKSPQKELVEQLNRMLEEEHVQDRFMVHADSIATNIRDKKANKRFAAKQVIGWLVDKGIRPQSFITTGDSSSDLEMAQEIHDKGLPVTFVFVGKETDRRKIGGQNLPFPVTFTQGKYEKGTLEYLASTT